MKFAPQLDGMVLTLTDQCNLRCRYCYVPVSEGRAMSPEIADRAVDFLMRQGQGDVQLSFFGGEPFLARDLLQRSVARARGRARPGQKVRVLSPTNGLAMTEADIAFCQRENIQLSLSIDGESDETGRAHCDGRSCAKELAQTLPSIARQLPEKSVLARMTVTPGNVDRLCTNLRFVAGLGLSRIIYQPDHTATWDEPLLVLWEREHRRIATWLLGAMSARRAIPELPAWRAIESRLVRGRKRAHCGAGVRQVAVTPDGDLVPCYRFVHLGASREESLKLGDVERGFTNDTALAQFRALTPEALHPEQGSCEDCPAHDGCTHFCPAQGWIERRDLAGVSATTCRLMRAQVESVRGLVVGHRRPIPTETPARRWAVAALLAASMTGLGAAGCDSSPLGVSDGGRKDSGATIVPDAIGGGGICAVQLRSDAATNSPDAFMGGGICPPMLTFDASVADDRPIYLGGVCPVMLPDVNGSDAESPLPFTPGIC
jgi:radical SAM protein with 4Fe4S-binding SPASM domain